MRTGLKQIQKASQRQLLLTAILYSTGAGLLVAIVLMVAGVYQPFETKAVPSNAVSFSELCYTIDDGNGTLISFNKLSGGPSDVGSTGIGSPEASTLNLVGDTLFVIDGSAGEFGYVNLSTGAYTVISSSFESQLLSGPDGNVLFEDIDAMTVDNEDVFWVASRDNNDEDPSFIAKMNRSGVIIEDAFGVGVDYIKFDGPPGFPSVLDAMAYDPIEEILYVCANDGSGNPTFNNLMTVDTETGEGTFVGNFNVGDVEGLGFDGEGNMYAVTGTSSNTSTNQNSFFSVNKTNAFATKVFSFSSGSDFETCDCIIGYKNTIKGTVFFDADENTFYGNGESGYPGVTVNLYYDENNNGVYDAGTDGFVRSTTTNNLGEYTLFDAYGSGTMNYVMTIDVSDLPTGYSLTTDNVETASFSSGGNTDIYNDFGYKLTSAANNTISGFVYGDEDQDQSFDGSESGIQSATVYLYQDVNGNGVYDEGSDLLITSTNTAADGSYSFVRPYTGGTSQVSVRVDRSNRDGEETGGTVDETSSDLDFGDKMVGVSFRNIGIPQGATIESAYFEVVSDGVYTDATTIEIYAEDRNSGRSMSSSTILSARNLTTASETWIMPYWSAADITYQSPDISAIVQEVVDRGGWSTTSNITLITTETSGNRAAKSFDGSSGEAPLLVVTYSDPTITDDYLTFVDPNSLPTGYSFTTDNVETASFSSGGNTDPNNNFGVYRDPASVNTISGTVFYDADGNATFNGSDVGTNNITVCLFNDINANGAYDDGTDELIQIVKTDADGNYSFTEPYETSLTIESYISQSSDDADGSTLSTTSSDFDLAEVDNAVRFQNIGIPQGATITNAYIEFEAEEDRTGSYSTLIEGVDVNSASSYNSSQNLSSLNRTSADATWSGSDDWNSGDKKTTPTITSIVQEIVDRSGWSSGNSMGFIFNEGSGKRTAHTFDSDPSKSPKLVIEYQNSTSNYVVIIKDSNLPAGYSFTTDNLETASFSSGGNSDIDNDFGYELNTGGINIISGTVFTDGNNSGTKDGSETGDVPNISIRLYDDADCDGQIDAGESIIATAVSNSSGDYSFNQVYNTNESLSIRVSQSSDDADESTLSLTSSDLDFAQSSVAVRFNGVSIPQGATISSASIEFTAEADKSGSYSFTVEGVDVDNASTFSSGQNLGSLTRTTEDATWVGSNAWTTNETYNSPSLTDIVQEIVDRNGWSNGNSMAFIFNTGSGDRDAYSFDADAGKAPRLIVQYVSSANKCYITEIVNSSIPQGGTVTTSSTHAQSFNSAGNTDSGNDFGIYFTPLPVEFIAFTGTWNNGTVDLFWATATELNNDYFDVEWSTDGVEFEVIGQVDGNGTDIDGEEYRFTHQNPAQLNFYRLRQVDYDEVFDYSKTISVSGTEDDGQLFDVSAYPNPFSTELNLTIQLSTEEQVVVQLVSTQGRVLDVQQYMVSPGSQTVPLTFDQSLQPGLYILNVKAGELSKSLRVNKR